MRNRLLYAICAAGLAIGVACNTDRRGEADRTADRTAEQAERHTEGAREAVSDAATTASVHAQLAADEGLRTLTSIDVTTENGVVRLSGEVPDEATKQRIEEVARKVDGVRSVENNLRVRPAGEPATREPAPQERR